MSGVGVPPPAWLVGRGVEWSRLVASLDAVLSGSGGLVCVSGEAGIGKSALVEAFVDEARRRGAQILAGSCYDLTITPPFGPWREALNASLPNDESLGIAPILSEVASVGFDSSQELFDEVRISLLQVAGQRAVVVVLEDLHWADAASLELLRFVSRRLNLAAVFLIVTWRDDESTQRQPLHDLLPSLVRESRPVRIELQRLQTTDTREMVVRRYTLDSEDQDQLAEWVQRHAEGNPFFSEEVTLALEQNRALRSDGERWHFQKPAAFSVPPLVRQVIESRLMRLGEPTRRLLEYAAIAGQDARLEVIQAASGARYDEVATTLDEGIAARIIVDAPSPDAPLHFRHALMRETLYERQTALRRRARHRRVAEVLLSEPDSSPSVLGYHFQAAHDERAVEWLARAGAQSLALYAPDDAIRHLTQAGELAKRFGVTLPLDAVRARGQAWEMIGDHGRAREDYESVLRVARGTGERRVEWQAVLDLGALWLERDYERAGELFQESLQLARLHVDDDAVAHSLNAIGNWHVNREDPQAGLRAHADALAIFTARDDLTGVAATHDLLGMASYVAGDIRRAAREYEQAVRLLEVSGNRRLLSSALTTWATTGGNYETIAVVAAEGRLEDWLNRSDSARTIAREIGWSAGEANADILAGSIYGPRGLMRDAFAHTDAGLALAERIGHQQWIALGHIVIGYLHSDLLNMAAARTSLESGRNQARSIGSGLLSNLASAALASVLIALGELDTADAILDAEIGTDWSRETPYLRHCWLARARLALVRDEPDQALTIVDRLLATAKHATSPRSIPWVALARAEAAVDLGTMDAAEAAYNDARDGALDGDYRHLLWRADAGLARLFMRTGKGADARAASDRALAVIDEIAETLPDDAQRREYLQRTRTWLPTLDGSPQGEVRTGLELSPREIEVLGLVAQGLTDAEVGERLSISFRTVGRHLQSIYNKLGVGSRTAAVSVAYERGIVTPQSRS